MNGARPRTNPSDPRTRLQKFLADAGVASRRRAEEWILAGRVLVNDAVVDCLPAFVDPESDRVVVDGHVLRPARLEYFIVHKPKRVVCASRDPAGRVRAVDLVPDLPARLAPVGRLDVEATGLLLMTNDGELAGRLAHPRSGVAKTYHVEVKGRAPENLAERLRACVYLAEGKARTGHVEILHAGQARSTLRVTLRAERYRQVQRMLAKLGLTVKKLKCVQYGPLRLHDLPLGAARRLSAAEIAALRAESAASPARPTRKGARRSPSAPRRSQVSNSKSQGPKPATPRKSQVSNPKSGIANRKSQVPPSSTPRRAEPSPPRRIIT